MSEIVLVRHGETEWSRSGQHTGITDLPLLPEGEEQALTVAPKLAGREFALVLSSPMQRARRTAELAGFGDRAEVDEDLRERNYGVYEGRTTKEIRVEHPGWDVWRDDMPGGETLEELAARADRVIERALAADGDTLVFAHSHLLRELGARWIGLAPGRRRQAHARHRGGLRARLRARAAGAAGMEHVTESTFNSLVGDLDYPMFIVTVCAGGERAGCLIGFATQASIDPSRFLVCLSHRTAPTAWAATPSCSACTSSPRSRPSSPSCSAARRATRSTSSSAARGARGRAARRCSTPARTASSAACSSASTPATTTPSCSSRCSPSGAPTSDEFTFHRAKRIEPGHEA